MQEISASTRRAIAFANFVAAAGVACLGLFLITAPMHVTPGDSHQGLMAVFPGILLLGLAWLIYQCAQLVLRRHIWSWIGQGVVVTCLVALGFSLLQ